MAERRMRALIESAYDDKGTKKAAKDFKDVGDSGEKGGKGVQNLAGSTGMLQKALGTVISAGLLYKGAQLMLDFGKASIQAASDVEETTSKFNVVFGQFAGDVADELGGFADQVNRSQYDLQGFASSIQDTLVPLGLARGAAADLSVEVVKLATDIGSFNNINDADVIRDIQSALVGNFETMRKYGVVLNEANVKQQAFNMGLYSGKGNIDAQSRALAAYQIILDSTSDAQGDAARTADSFANVSRGLDAAIMDLKVAIGQQLLPQMTRLKMVATETVSALADNFEAQNALRDAAEKGTITDRERAKAMHDLRTGIIEVGDVYWMLRERETGLTRVQLTEADRWKALAALYPEAAAGLDDVALAEYNVEAAMDQLHDVMKGKLDQETEEFTKGQREAATSLVNLKARIEELGGTTFMPPAQRKNLEDLREQLHNVSVGIAMTSEELEKGELNRREKLAAQDRLEELRTEAWNLEQQIKKIGGVPYLSNEQQAELDGLQEEFQATTRLIEEQAEAHTQATRQILFNMLEQKLAADELTEEEAQMLEDLASKWGLVDEATAMAMEATEEAAAIVRSAGADAKTAAERVGTFYSAWEALNDLNQLKSFRIRVNAEYREQLFAAGGETNPYGKNNQTMKGKQVEGNPTPSESKYGGQFGLDMIVPGNFDNDTFGPFYASSRERVTITPANKIGHQGNVVFNFHIPIYEAGDPEAIVQFIRLNFNQAYANAMQSGILFSGT